MNTLLRKLSLITFVATCPWVAAQDDPFASDPFASDPFASDPFASDPFASDPFASDPPPKIIRVQVEFIEMSTAQSTALLAGPHHSTNDGPLRQQVAELVAQGKATISETLVCSSPVGQKSTTESITELIYATEYEPPEITGTVIGIEPNRDPNFPPNKLIEVGTQDEYLGPSPSAWDTRNLGPTLEIEPDFDEATGVIHLRFVAEIVRHVGDWIWTEWVGPHGTSHIRMPTMYTLRCSLSTYVPPGEYQLAAALTPKNEAGVNDPTRKVMVFVKCGLHPPGG